MVLTPTRCPPEGREKTARLALDHLDEYGSAYAAAHAIGPRVDVHPATLRVWIVAALKDVAKKPTSGSGLDAAERAELERLHRENGS